MKHSNLICLFYCLNNTRKSEVIFISRCSNKYNKNRILNSHWKEHACIKFHPKTFDEALEVQQKYSSTLSLTSVLDGVGGQCHGPNVLPPGKTLGTRFTGGCVGHRDCLDGCRKHAPTGIRSPDRPTCIDSLNWYATRLYYNEQIIHCVRHKIGLLN
jgi:hypothetical protein